MKLLFVHSNYPSQFRRLVPRLVELGHEVIFLASQREWHSVDPDGFNLKAYRTHRSGGSELLHQYLRRFDQAVLEGQAVYRSCVQLREEGWVPDWIINHVGFGVGFYIRDAFPSSRRIGLFEWFYNAEDSDVDFLNRGPVEPDRRLRLRTWNAQTLLELADVDFAVTPTSWQQKQFPQWMRDRLKVIHEGIDCDVLKQLSTLTKDGWPGLPANAEVVTYVSRGFEEYRGFPQAMRAFAILQQLRPNVHVLIAGSDLVAYGPGRPDGRSWQTWAQQDAGMDPQRTHWLGALQTPDYHRLLHSSHVHLYLTVPFVLSWSLLEAMGAGCCIVSSATPPVEEVITSGEHGLLCEFYDSDQQAKAMARLLEDRSLAETLGIAAQERARHYDVESGLQSWCQLLSSAPDSASEPSCQPVCLDV